MIVILKILKIMGIVCQWLNLTSEEGILSLIKSRKNKQKSKSRSRKIIMEKILRKYQGKICRKRLYK